MNSPLWIRYLPFPRPLGCLLLLLAAPIRADEIDMIHQQSFELERAAYQNAAPHCAPNRVRKIVDFQSRGEGAAQGPAETRSFTHVAIARKALALVAPPNAPSPPSVSKILADLKELHPLLSDTSTLKILESLRCNLTPASDLLERLARFQKSMPTAFTATEKAAYVRALRAFLQEDESLVDFLPLLIRMNVLLTSAQANLTKLSDSEIIQLQDLRHEARERFESLRARKPHLQEGEADVVPDAIAVDRAFRMIDASVQYRPRFLKIVQQAFK